MVSSKLDMAEVFFRALTYSSKVTKKYGEAAEYGRVWDCSWFVANCIRAITGIANIYTGSKASQAVTGLFTAYCSDKPCLTPFQLPLLFLYDKDDTDYAQKTAHVGIAIPDANYLGMLEHVADGNAGCLSTVYTLDLYEDGGIRPPHVHPVADWFKVTPLTNVRVVKFAGVDAPSFPDGVRFMVAPAFMDLNFIQKAIAIRG